MPFQIDPYLSEKLQRVETGMGSGQDFHSMVEG